MVKSGQTGIGEHWVGAAGRGWVCSGGVGGQGQIWKHVAPEAL